MYRWLSGPVCYLVSISLFPYQFFDTQRLIDDVGQATS